MPDNLRDDTCTITSLLEGNGKLGINSTAPGFQGVVVDASISRWEVKKVDGEDYAYILSVIGYGCTYCNGMIVTAGISPDRQEWYITYQEVHDAYNIAMGKHDASSWNGAIV